MLNNYIFARANGKYQRNLVAYLSFDDNLIKDFTGNHEVKVNNNVMIDDLNHVGTGKSASFNRNSSSYLELSQSSDFTLNSEYTISFWIRLSSLNNFEIISKRQTTTTNLEFQFSYMSSGELRFRLWSMDVNHYIGFNFPFSLNLSQWYHLVLTYDGSIHPNGISLYIDSLKMDLSTFYLDSNSFSGVISTEYGLKIGIGGSVNYLDGNIDELGFWKHRIFNQEDVNFIFNNGIGRKP
ncbi:LamG domain-containing protein [Neptunitalea lumnitzerae]|uniref:LamG domain-containing protein n=1 Tax=Neptunitalea lumnitzerae TaxID=2965509 RepID=A0ABQ5MFF5_9FLAO|nr:LamG domain-containing protein [Neptunitalea sp. Y10]GLB47750.1 hypothetical protein Y10_01180 [Neptunitalea sp. Y10]